MTIEEFFKKKRIDLAALEKAEPALFSEFKAHFEQMGEKSFDHSKKYWFNKLRHQFHLAPELKPERVRIENPIAEQTVTESLVENVTAPPLPKLGFAPKFKASNMPKPPAVQDQNEETPPAPVVENTISEKPAGPATQPALSSAKLGFVPKFKAGNTPKPAVAADKMEETPTAAGSKQTSDEMPLEGSQPKPVYKPRFNMKNLPPKAEE
jgi:hypothetical protein